MRLNYLFCDSFYGKLLISNRENSDVTNSYEVSKISDAIKISSKIYEDFITDVIRSKFDKQHLKNLYLLEI